MHTTPEPTVVPSGTGDLPAEVVCYHCNAIVKVSQQALTVVCPHCHKALRLEDLAIKGYQARRIVETYGVITVERNGQVISDRVICGGLVVRGKVKGNVSCQGPVVVSAEAEIKGDVSAPTLAVKAGALLEGHYAIGKS